MAQQEYKIGLSNPSVPMLSEQQTRTIIGSTAGESPASSDKPGIAYFHNVMPTFNGLDSIGFKSKIAAALPAGVTMEDVRVAYGDARSRVYLGWDSAGNAYALRTGSTIWLALPATVPVTSSPMFSVSTVTIGTVNGVSYIMFSGIGAFTYNETTNVLDAVTLTGLDITTVLGVVASSGYLVAYTFEAIVWSSTIDPTDFIPSQVTGSGGGNVAGTAGDILFCTDNTLGLLIYTDANIIAGTYTGNARFPFKFREVDNSKGGIDLDNVAYEANSSSQYVYSKAGVHSVTSQKAEVILADVTDFLAGKRFEDYNETTDLYEVTDLSASETMLKKIKFIASRYLIFSYGLPATGFTHALVFDTSLKKIGKLKIDHTDVFEYIGTQSEVSKESVAFLLPTGEIKTLDFSVSATSSGVLVLGKLQFVRTRMIDLHEVVVENVPEGATLTVLSQASVKGKGFTNVTGFLADTDEEARTYNFHSEAKNHSIVFKGQFNLITAQVTYSIGAKR